MKALARLIENIFTTPTRSNENIYREWERQRSKAMGPNDLAEIDAIFSRSV